MARIQDAVDLCDKRHKPQFIGFLDEKEADKPYLFLEHMREKDNEPVGFSTPQEFVDNWNKNNERG